MAPPNITLRGIRKSIPSGYMLGRKGGGRGGVELISIADVVQQGQAQGGGGSTVGSAGTGFGTNGQVWTTVAGAAAWAFNTLITGLGTVTSGVWNATKIALAYGGTNADLSATGPGFLKQASGGANVTVAALADSDLPTQGGLTPGSYTLTSLTVNAQGFITAASNGSAGGSGTVTSVGMTVPTGLAVSGSPITTAGTLAVTWSGLIPLAQGGTHVDLTGTGPGYLKQASSGASVTVSATIPYSDVTGGPAASAGADWDAYVQGGFGVGAFGSGGFGSLNLEDANNGQLQQGALGQTWLHGGAGAVPNWGRLGVTWGGTAADLSATGGAGQVLKQASAGAAITVGTLADTELSGAAWTAYTPTVGATSGTITTASATGRYKQIGKTVFVQIRIDITTNGSGAGAVTATLPVAPFASAVYFLSGREIGVSGKVLSVTIANSLTVNIQNYDNTYPGANGASLTLTGVYEAT